jgi:3-hydroxybutyryl-CoA dehydrogenase
MGPLALCDMAGLDTLLYIARDLYDKLKDPAYAPPVLLQKMVAAGWYGRKSGKGFYEYK